MSAIKFRKKFFEVYDTDSPAEEIWLLNIYYAHRKVQVSKDQEKARSEKDSHSKNRDGKNLN